MFLTYISLLVFATSVVCSWIGFTLLSVQMLIWWIMQLTCILTISCLASWMSEYAAKHHLEEKPINKTWIYRLLLKVIIPLMAISSILISIYWAADVFNLSDQMMRIFTTRFIDVSNFSVSISSIATVLALWFVFAYISYITIEFMRLHLMNIDSRTAASRNVMGKNIVQVVVWGTWLLISPRHSPCEQHLAGCRFGWSVHWCRLRIQGYSRKHILWNIANGWPYQHRRLDRV